MRLSYGRVAMVYTPDTAAEPYCIIIIFDISYNYSYSLILVTYLAFVQLLAATCKEVLPAL